MNVRTKVTVEVVVFVSYAVTYSVIFSVTKCSSVITVTMLTLLGRVSVLNVDFPPRFKTYVQVTETVDVHGVQPAWRRSNSSCACIARAASSC